MSNNLPTEKSQLQQAVTLAREIQTIIQGILDRPAPASRGTIEFQDAVIELPDERPYDPRD